MKLGIIADDLTGACDTAAQLRYYDLRILVTSWTNDRIDMSVDALALNTQSRHIASSRACERARVAARKLSDCGVVNVYKKIDSTLHGNWIFEVEELLKNADFRFALIAPAFPRRGRTTIDGWQYVNGSLLESSLHGVGSERSSIIDSLRKGSAFGSDLIPMEIIEKGAAEIKKEMETLTNFGARLIICDAESETDLEEIVLAGRELRGGLLWVGSAGLARYWPRAVGYCDEERRSTLLAEKPMLFVLGSFNPVSRSQVALLQARKQIRGIEINPDAEKLDSARRIQEAVNELLSGRSLILKTPDARYENAELIRTSLSSAVSKLCHSAPVGTLVLVGGDTAETIGEQLSLDAIEIEGEVEPGIPYGTIRGGILDGRPIVTKAGGFGREDALLELSD